MKPSYSVSELKNQIPELAFQPSLFLSLFYFFFDIGILALIYLAAFHLNSVWFLPFFWFASGTMMWALFVVGHDCGHGSFSKVRWLNFFIGHLAHTPILVPFHGWKVSHRTHHNNTGNIDKDESWHPLTEDQYKNADALTLFARFKLFLFVFPLYLFVRSTGRDGSHFHPNSPLFPDGERKNALISTIWILAMASFLSWIVWQYGVLFFITYYFIPYTVFVVWLSLVTYLHHTDVSLPWYRGDAWNYVDGALSTIDRSYGIFENIHHNIGTHVVHHLFPTIPHYRLKLAKQGLKEYLGEDYRETKESVWASLFKSMRECIVVPNEGTKVFYKKPDLTQN
ncbi:fatty acid desaturase [Leptospira kobayashii]|uniref:Fatty acid desaturase n=1 Tax=Leptospira kobayashii TaxID=1917830 RepID=A0ABM7UKQ1_9LEPT|nr:fatty acid desaturase [Leptospira kobayashii]BDA79415.1 fatty acid desaturase [Leptospira kobayashii]